MLARTSSITTMCHFFQIGELKDEQCLITSKHSVFNDLMNVKYVSLSVEILEFVTSCLSFALRALIMNRQVKGIHDALPDLVFYRCGVSQWIH